jgi:hypothetical protein
MKNVNLPIPLFKTDSMLTLILYRTIEETIEIILNAIRNLPGQDGFIFGHKECKLKL